MFTAPRDVAFLIVSDLKNEIKLPPAGYLAVASDGFPLNRLDITFASKFMRFIRMRNICPIYRARGLTARAQWRASSTLPLRLGIARRIIFKIRDLGTERSRSNKTPIISPEFYDRASRK